MRYSNCLVFALGAWFSRGGYLLVRRSRHGWWPHFLWLPGLDRKPQQFRADLPKSWRTLPLPLRVLPLHILWFRGEIIEGDE